MTEEQMGKGAIVSPPDSRDYKYCELGNSTQPFDWNSIYDVEAEIGALPVKDQGNTSACGGFAFATLSYALDSSTREEKSEKFIYAHTAAPGGGSSGRANSQLCKDKGVCKKILCPLPNPLTEAAITLKDITPEAYADALSNREQAYFSEIYPNIDTVAQMVRDNKGAVLLLRGQNNGTWLSAHPKPPALGSSFEQTWGHFVYAGKVRMDGEKKFIGVLNSWGTDAGDKGWQYLGEEYFQNRFVVEAWTMVELGKINWVFNTKLRLFSFGVAVKMLQLKLGLTADGIFGLKTRQAVINFQLAHGLVGDGVVGTLTNNELNK